MLRAGECITGRQFKRMYHVSLIVSNRYNISILIDNSVKNRDNLKNVLQSVYTNKEAVDDELVEVTIFLIKPPLILLYIGTESLLKEGIVSIVNLTNALKAHLPELFL